MTQTRASDVRPRQIRQNDEQRARFAVLLAKKKLTELEKGELKSLGLTGSQAQDDLVRAKLGPPNLIGGKGKAATVGDLPKLPNVLFDDDGNLL